MEFCLRRMLPIAAVLVLVVYEERVSSPSCKLAAHGGTQSEEEEELKVMMVANLLLLGSEATPFDVYFKEYHLSRFFLKSFETLKPDMLIVLGDVSARGAELGERDWSVVINQFYHLLGPFLGLPYHVVLGDRDVGGCNELNAGSVNWIASNFPGIDSAGCGAFKISNISFVSLNAVALLCGNSNLRPGVEGAVERESLEHRKANEHDGDSRNKPKNVGLPSSDFSMRRNSMSPRSGPVLLLHIPLHHSSHGHLEWHSCNAVSEPVALDVKQRVVSGAGPYELRQTLPLNATEYIFQALKPRMIFSGHTHEFSERIHPDGTLEITVPAMSWYGEKEPGFVVASFRGNGREATVSHCTLTRESHVLVAYTIIVLGLILSLLLASCSNNPRN